MAKRVRLDRGVFLHLAGRGPKSAWRYEKHHWHLGRMNWRGVP